MNMRDYRKMLGLLSGAIAIALALVPIFAYRSFDDIARNAGYIGYFFASYLGFGIYTLPFLVEVLNPVLLIAIGTFGITLDEFFAWYAGKVSEEIDRSKKFHSRIQSYVERYGLLAVFTLGCLPLPSYVYAVSGFAAGHFKIPFYRFFLINLSGKLVKMTVIVVSLLVIL